jgi:hypothetical protein
MMYKYKQQHEFVQDKKQRHYEYCNCDVNLWTQNNLYFKSEIDVILQNIHNHVYNHILCTMLSEPSINIVSDYVGNIYVNHCRDYPQVHKVQIRVTTLGIPFVTENHLTRELYTLYAPSIFDEIICKVDINRDCFVPYCGAPYIKNLFGLCYEHFKQYMYLPELYIHNHGCNECCVNIIREYRSLISKLNMKLYRDVINYILSYCVSESFCICRGHMLPKKYNCKICLESAVDLRYKISYNKSLLRKNIL